MLRDYELYNALMKEVEDGNVSLMDSACKKYRIFKYTMGCHMKSAWNDANVQARGIIFNIETKDIVCRPMKKFLNLNEAESTKLENLPKGEFFITEKLDGSCVSSWVDENNLRFATPGSTESDQAKWAEQWFQNVLSPEKYENLKEASREATFIFEAIYPENRNIVLYGDRTECVLLTIKYHNGAEARPHIVDGLAKYYGFTRPRSFKFELSNSLQFPDNEEGYVVYWPDYSFRVKVKSPTYVMLHKMKDSFSEKGICEVLAEGRLKDFMDILPPHMQKEADDIASVLRTKFYGYKNIAEDVYQIVKNLGTRKDQAIKIQSICPRNLWSSVFLMLDSNYTDRNLWRIIYKEINDASTSNICQ